MKFISLILAVAVSTNAFAQSKPAISYDKMAEIAKLQTQESEAEYQKSVARVEKLRIDLKKAKGEGAQHTFKRIAQVCGVGATAFALMAILSSSEKYGHLFGRSADERVGGVMVGVPFALIGGACAGITGVIYEITNGKVEDVEALLEAAEIELKLQKHKRENP